MTISYYGKSMKVVDEGVRRVVEVIEDFFGHDGKTSYIFTSDHGMTDWGLIFLMFVFIKI